MKRAPRRPDFTDKPRRDGGAFAGRGKTL